MPEPRSMSEWRVSPAIVFAVALAPAAAAAFLVTHQIMAAMWDHDHTWWRMFSWQLAGWGFWAIAAPLLVASGARLSRSWPWWRHLPKSLGVGLSCFAAQFLFVAAVASVTQPYVPVGSFNFVEFLLDYSDRWIFINLVEAGGLLGTGHLLASYHKARGLELQESRLEAELAKAQLETLRLQMEPHFLFNTLNSISALIRRGDTDRALATVGDLGSLLRDTLDRANRNEVSLRDELEFVSRYLQLQKTRFADRLEAEVDIPEECLDLAVPTLLLQTLVENSVRHGLTRSSALLIRITAKRGPGFLSLEVSDDGPGLPEGFELDRDAGIGLGNLQSRLRHLYDGVADLRLDRKVDGGTVSSVRLPSTAMEREIKIAAAS